MIDIPFNVVEYFLTPILFIFYVIFVLLEMAYAHESVLVIVWNISSVITYCYRSG